MTAPPADTAAAAARPKPSRAQRVAAFAFLGAFALTMLTVILTGLYVRSPSSRRTAENPAVTLTLGEPRTINLVFAARSELADVEVTADLPPGIELQSQPGRRRAEARIRLARGDTAVPLTLVAQSGPGGQLAVRLRQGEEQKTFVVDVTVAGP